MKKKRMGALALLLLAAAAAVIILGGMQMKLDWTAELGSEGTAALQNPERGWYHMTAYEISDEIAYDWTQKQNFDDFAAGGDTLALVEIKLAAYQDGEISAYGLETIRGLFQRFRETRMKAIVRFLYDWDGYGKATEPAALSTVLLHMDQVGAILQDFEDTVYVAQGVFVGAWAEMHTSKHLSRDNVKTLVERYYSATGGKVFLAVRTPAFWRIATGRTEPLESRQAFSGSLASTLGLFNDGLSASVSDVGTYADNPQLPAGEAWESWGREAELSFQEQLCRYVPSGGESGIVNKYNTMEQLLKDLPRMHISYLSGEFSQDVHESWENEDYTGDGPFQGKSFRDYLEAHLGYRFLLENCALRTAPFLKFSATLELNVKNTGFAGLTREKTVKLLFVPQSGGENRATGQEAARGSGDTASAQTVELPVEADVRDWTAGSTRQLSVSLRKKDLPEGTYKVYLKISEDSPSFAIQAANENAFDQALEANYLGTLSVG